MRYSLVMAGGIGTRLWPLSRRSRPKQLLPILGDRSLLALAVGRLDEVVPPAHRLVCTSEHLREPILAMLPDLDDAQILGEPEGRNTANAIGLAAALLVRRDPDAVMAVLTADHLIEPEAEFRRCVDTGFRLAEDDRTRFVTFSIRATFAATGYGWVERGDPVNGFGGAYVAQRFDEKPDLATAQRYLDSDRFGWNSGNFIFHAGAYMDALADLLPAARTGLDEIADAWETSARVETLRRVYPTLPKISVDHAVMNPAASHDRFTVCTVPMDVSWLDVGSWPTYAETLDADDDGNRRHGPAVHLDSRNVLTVTDDDAHTIATIGCSDLIVIHTKDATLVCRERDAQRVREMAERVGEKLR